MVLVSGSDFTSPRLNPRASVVLDQLEPSKYAWDGTQLGLLKSRQTVHSVLTKLPVVLMNLFFSQSVARRHSLLCL